MKSTPSQGRRLIMLLKRRGMTYMQMLSTGISTSPWKRVEECLMPTEVVRKTKNGRGLVVWRVVSATKWTACRSAEKHTQCSRQVWQPGSDLARTPRVFWWGVCRHNLVPSPSQCLPTPRATPHQSAPGFLRSWHSQSWTTLPARHSRKRDKRPDEF